MLTTTIETDYLIEGFPTLAEGHFIYQTPGRKAKVAFYFRGLSDGRWTLGLGKEIINVEGSWKSEGFGMDAETAHAILVDCVHEWGESQSDS